MKMIKLIVVVMLLLATSCQQSFIYPRTIAKSETFDASSELVARLNIIAVISEPYHLEEGYTSKEGKTLICRSEAKQHTIVFYKPAEDAYLRVGKPVHFGTKHPVGTIHKNRQAFKGEYKDKTRIAYLDSGQLIIEDI